MNSVRFFLLVALPSFFASSAAYGNCTPDYPQEYYNMLNAGSGNCYIMVHGHRSNNATTNFTSATQNAHDYWYSSSKDDGTAEDLNNTGFQDRLLNAGESHTFTQKCTYEVTKRYWWGGKYTETKTKTGSTTTITTGQDKFGIVGYASQYAYDHVNAADLAAQQIYNIRKGQGDGLPHSKQCTGNEDNFIIVAHSMGGAVTSYINGRAALAPNNSNYKSVYDKAINGDSSVPPVTTIVTVGGATLGTEGADYICSGGALGGLAQLFLGDCDPGTNSLRTSSSVRLEGKIGSNAATSVLAIGGYAELPFPLNVSSGFISGEDDGVVNLHTQMGCTNISNNNAATNGWQEGLYKDVKVWKWNACGFLNTDQCWYVDKWCDEQDKSLGRSHNFLSADEDHDNQRNARDNSISQVSNNGGARNSNENYRLSDAVTNCNSGQSAAGHIKSCLANALGDL